MMSWTSLEALVDCNKQRTKTNEQYAREAAALMKVEKERAARRQQDAGRRKSELPETLPEAGASDAELPATLPEADRVMPVTLVTR